MDVKLKKLAVDVAKGQSVGNYSYDDMHEAFRTQMANLVCDEQGKIDYYKWEENSKKIFALMGEMADVILPARVTPVLGKFADFKAVGDGDKPRFYLKKGKKNVKRFVTKVAAAGVYERVRLDRDYFDVEVYAHGGAVYQTLEGFLAGRENITEVLDILLEGLEDEMYSDLTTALEGTFSELPDANKATGSAFSASEMDKVVATVAAYGTPTIFCTREFASTIKPEDGFVADADKNDMRERGYIGKYKGTPIVLLPQSFTDETNTQKVINPKNAYVMPSGANGENPVKVVLEGQTKIRQMDREDWSLEIQLYKKMGLAITNTNHYGIVTNTSL